MTEPLGTPHPARWHRRLVNTVWCITGLLALLALVRFSIGWVFPVASSSMWPTLKPHEWVFLRWDRSLPARFDLVAFRSEGGEAVVKRVWGLPRETVLIEPAGDVRINSELVRSDARPRQVRVFDSTTQSIGEHWFHGGTEHDPWQRVVLEDESVGEVWEVDSRPVPERYDASLLRHHKGVHDDRMAADGTLEYGTVTVHDLTLGAEVYVVDGGGRLRFELLEQGDRLEFSLELPIVSGPAQGFVRRRRGESHVEHARQTFEVPIGRWFRVTFANIDDELTATVDDQPPLRCQYHQNTPHPKDENGDGSVDSAAVSIGERAFLGADKARVRFRALTLDRDIHVPAIGAYGVGRELQLGIEEVYVLGDDPTRSRDSRAMGPIPLDRLIGRPTHVVWPPSAWRRIQR
jgi:hypothetical protein